MDLISDIWALISSHIRSIFSNAPMASLPVALSGDCLSVIFGFVDDLSVTYVCREWARVMSYVRKTLTYYVCPLREKYTLVPGCRLCVPSSYWAALAYWNSCRVMDPGTMIFPERESPPAGVPASNYAARGVRRLPVWACRNTNHQHLASQRLLPMSNATETKVAASAAPASEEKPQFVRKPKAKKDAAPKKEEGKKARKKDTVRDSVKKASKKPVSKDVREPAKTIKKPRAPKKGVLSDAQKRLVDAVAKTVLDGLGSILAPKPAPAPAVAPSNEVRN